MRLARRSASWRRQLERKKRLVEVLGGKVAATHSSSEVPMRQTMPKVVDTGSEPARDPVAALMASALVNNSHAQAHRAIADPATAPIARLFFRCMTGELGEAAQRAAALCVIEEHQRNPEQPLPPDYERELNRVYGERCAEDGDLTQRGNNGNY